MATGGDWDEVTYLKKKQPKAAETKTEKVIYKDGRAKNSCVWSF